MFKINYSEKKIRFFKYYCYWFIVVFLLLIFFTEQPFQIKNILGFLFVSLAFGGQIWCILYGIIIVVVWFLKKINLIEFENTDYTKRLKNRKIIQKYFSNTYIPKPTIDNVPPVEKTIRPSPRENYIDYLQKMDWRQFEIYISKILERHGYKTQVTPAQNDEGKDIIATKDNVTYFIECKHYTSGTLIGREALQKLCGAAVPYKVKRLIFITLSGYNSNAIEYAQKVNATEDYKLTLLQTEEIIEMAKEVNML